MHGDVWHTVHDPNLFDYKVFISLQYSCAMLNITGTGPMKLWGATELNNSMPTFVLVDGYLYGTHHPSDVWVSGGDWNKMH